MRKILLTLCIFSSIATAADVPVGVAYRDFSGGLNNFSASVALAPNESPSLLNVVIDEPPSAITQRNGYQSCGSIPSGNTATNLYEFSRNDGSRNLIATDNRSVWSTADCTNWVLVSTGLPATSFPRFATINNKLWIVNGSNHPIVWDGISTTTLDGTNGSPLAPATKYITFWKSRVWLANSTADPSGVYFSALVDNAGNILDPATSSGAWSNINNLIYFDRDNGSPIYGMKIYRDNMYVFKENNIDRLVFNSEFVIGGIQVGKSVSTTGSKFNESIVEMDDGILRFLGKDGVYRFDGSTVQRISTKWTPTFYAMKQPSHSEKSRIWDSNYDFLKGNLSNITTTYLTNSIAFDFSPTGPVINFPHVTKSYDTFSDGDFTNNPTWIPTGDNYFSVVGNALKYYPGNVSGAKKGQLYSSTGTWNTGEWDLSITEYNPNHALNVIGRYYFTSSGNNPLTSNGYVFEMNKQSYSLFSISIYKNIAGALTLLGSQNVGTASALNSCSDIRITRDISGQIIAQSVSCGFAMSVTDTQFMNMGSLGLALEAGSDQNSYCTSDCPYVAFDDIQAPVLIKATGTWTSEVSTATSLSLWKTFNTDETLNGQTINYSIRVASTVAAVLTSTWTSIVSGSGVSSTTYQYAQWKADLATTNNVVTPALNSGSLSWISGDASLSPITAIDYKSRYWLSASTTAGNNYNDIVMVENKTMGASVPGLNYTMFNIPISAMTLWNNNLYASISNTPNIARLDYGQTDDGAPITSYWQSRAEIDQNPLFYKSINKQILDFSTTPSNPSLKIGLSPDMGNTWNYRTVNTGLKAPLPRSTYVINPSTITMSLQYSSQIYNNTPGIGYTIYGLHAFGTSTEYYGANQ